MVVDTIKENLCVNKLVAYTLSLHDALPRSEERRVGKEC